MERSKKKKGRFDDHVRRAFAAWFRSGETEQPTNRSGHVRHKDLDYVVLLNEKRDALAVYRIRRFDGMLKRLKRWPDDLVK